MFKSAFSLKRKRKQASGGEGEGGIWPHLACANNIKLLSLKLGKRNRSIDEG